MGKRPEGKFCQHMRKLRRFHHLLWLAPHCVPPLFDQRTYGASEDLSVYARRLDYSIGVYLAFQSSWEQSEKSPAVQRFIFLECLSISFLFSSLSGLGFYLDAALLPPWLSSSGRVFVFVPVLRRLVQLPEDSRRLVSIRFLSIRSRFRFGIGFLTAEKVRPSFIAMHHIDIKCCDTWQNIEYQPHDVEQSFLHAMLRSC